MDPDCPSPRGRGVLETGVCGPAKDETFTFSRFRITYRKEVPFCAEQSLFSHLTFISLEDEPWEPIEPNPNAAPAEEPVAAEPGLSESDWTLASTETVTHEYLTQNGKVARETIRQDVGGTVLSTKTLDFFYDDSGRPFAFNYSVDGSDFETYYYILNLQGDVVQIIDEARALQAEYI